MFKFHHKIKLSNRLSVSIFKSGLIRYICSMRLRKYLYPIAQIGGWSSYGLIILLASYAQEPKSLTSTIIVNVLVIVLAAILVTHCMRLIFLKLGWLNLKLGPLIPRVLVISVLSSTLLAILNYTFDFLFGDLEQYKGKEILYFFIDIIGNLILILFWNAVYFSYHFFSKSRKQELDNVILEVSKNEFELKNLRSQLNPHFLFNSLNSIRALIDIEPHNAKHSITILSQLLRNSLKMGKETAVKLEEELDLVSHYLELEAIRFEERLTVSWDLDKSMFERTVPPFIIQAQVENAIKHGISDRISGGNITIHTYTDDDMDVYEIRNSGKLKSNMDDGIGLENTEKRLLLQYKGQASFRIYESGENVVAEIKIRRL